MNRPFGRCICWSWGFSLFIVWIWDSREALTVLLLSYCVIIDTFWEALAHIFWRIDSSGAGLMESLWQKKRERVCFFLYLFYPLLFLSLKAFSSYPAWKNLPDCIKPDATEIVHFLMRSRADSTVKRYLAKRKFKSSLLGARLAILASNFLFLSPPVENTYCQGHAYPWRYLQKIRLLVI